MKRVEVIAAMTAAFGERVIPSSLMQFERNEIVISTMLYFVQIPYSKVSEIESEDEYFVIRTTGGVFYIIDHINFRMTTGCYG